MSSGSGVIITVISHLFCNIYVYYFDAGMPISEAFAQIEHQPNIYDVVHVKYLDEVCCLCFFFFFVISYHQIFDKRHVDMYSSNFLFPPIWQQLTIILNSFRSL